MSSISRALSVFSFSLACLVACFAALSCSSGSKGGSCPQGSETCPCYGNQSCNVGLTCASSVCVNLGGIGTGGMIGGGGMSGGGTGGMSGGGTGGSLSGAGGSGAGTGGSATGTGGSATGTGGSVTGVGGGAASGTGGSAGCSCPSTQSCTTDGRCVDPKVIDDFIDCNTSVNLINGRNGSWYEAADVGVNVTFGVSAPPSSFSDHGCGAWETGGPTGNGTTTYAIMGADMTSAGTPVNFSAYTGLQVSLESGQTLGFTIKTTNGGYFQTSLPVTAGAETFMYPFSSFLMRGDSLVSALNLADVLDIQFTVLDPSVGYGFAVHSLSLY
jgi:hypothetical protein